MLKAEEVYKITHGVEKVAREMFVSHSHHTKTCDIDWWYVLHALMHVMLKQFMNPQPWAVVANVWMGALEVEHQQLLVDI